MKGIVMKSTGSWYIVKTDEATILQCRIKGKFRTHGIKHTNPVAVGDRVTLELQEDGTANITAIDDRKNLILRKATKLSKQTQIIATNIDQVVLVATLSVPRTLDAFVDRFLATAEAYRVPSIIVFNKVDMYPEEVMEELAYYTDVYSDVGYRCIATSATQGTNIDELKEVLTNNISLLAGNSGVGKSTLINAVEPELDLKTSQISLAYLTGKHTTTFAEMFDLSFGGAIIDTPGLKSFGLYDFQKEEVWHFFPEIFAVGQQCKFHNCVHINEPKCAVKEAVEGGTIADFRYRNYITIYYGDDLETEY